MSTVIDYCVRVRDVRRVAFYDRASTKPQATNWMRKYYCDMAMRVSEEHGFELVESGDERNYGVCFLDVGTGVRWDNRPQLQRILDDETVDSVAFLEFDRLARGVDVQQRLFGMVRAAGKNLLWIRTQEDIDRDTRFMQILESYLGLNGVIE